MEKDFEGWIKVKQALHEQEHGPYGQVREIWWCALGINVGHEQDGKDRQRVRPVLIVKRFNAQLLWIVPLTSKKKERPFYLPTTHDGKTTYLLLSQMRAMSNKRLIRLVRKLPQAEFKEVRKRLRQFIP